MSILIDNFRHPDGPYLGLGDVAEIVAVQFNLLGPWVFGPGRDSFDVVAVVGFVGLLALWGWAVWVARSRRAASDLRLHALLGVAWLLAVVSIARIFGPYFEYTVRWLWLLTVLVITASVWTLWRGSEATGRATRRIIVGGVSIAVVVAIVAGVQFATRAEPTGASDSRIVGGLVPEILDDLDHSERYLLRWWDPAVLGATGFGMVLELERRGLHGGRRPAVRGCRAAAPGAAGGERVGRAVPRARRRVDRARPATRQGSSSSAGSSPATPPVGSVRMRSGARSNAS